MTTVPTTNVQLSFVASPQVAARVLAVLQAASAPAAEDTRGEEEKETIPFPLPTTKRKRRTKAEMEALRAGAAKESAEEEEEDDKDDGDDIGESEDGEETEDEIEEEEPAPVKTKSKLKTPVLSFENDVRPALRDFVKRTDDGSTKARKILAKFGVKTASELPPHKFGALIDILRA